MKLVLLTEKNVGFKPMASILVQSKRFLTEKPNYPKESRGSLEPQKEFSEDQEPMFLKFKNRIFGKKSSENVQTPEEKEQELADKSQNQMEREREIEERENAILKASNRSRLFYSDRNLMQNKLPQAGILWQKNETHQSREFQSMMLSRFGQKATKINPSVAWPTSEEINLQKEYENVKYDGLSLKQMIANAKKAEKEQEQAVIDLEKKLAENLAKHGKEIEGWKKRVEGRNTFAQKERNKRQQIFDEVSCNLKCAQCGNLSIF